MKMVKRVAELRELLRPSRKIGKSIGFVPTMGYLHEGHLALMHQAKQENDWVVASIFVNPLQFGPGEDYALYPRDLDRDGILAASAGVDFLFVPEVTDMYPQGYENMLTSVDVAGVTAGLCGASRPGHFRGVATVVSKLFNIVEPDKAYFGQKDAQQVAVIRQMIVDLNMNIEVISVPIVREADGLALSSRNVYLNPEERQAALVLSQALQWAQRQLTAGKKDCYGIINGIRDRINQEPRVNIDYVTAVDAHSLQELQIVDRPTLLAVAVKIGKTRLIDNLIWEG